VSCRLGSDPPLVVEWYRVVLDAVSVPPLPAPILFVHTGGKPASYRSRHSAEAGRSLPGLVTVMPRLVQSEVSLGGVGEGAMVYFEDERRIPSWVTRLAPGEPVTVVDELMSAAVRQVIAAAREGDADPSYLAALGNLLLVQAQHALTRPAGVANPRGSRSALLLAHTAVEHVRSHLDDDLSVEAIARRCGVGATHFAKTFREVTGTTPHRYVRQARIDRACELLRTTAMSIGEIAGTVGFAGQGHFCTAFRRERGMTPSTYRRSCRESERRPRR
jgi:AraC-like DNA-binding protein